jgi:hypothetical protein
MMKKALKITLLILVLAALYVVALAAAKKGLLGEAEFGYYKEYYIAKHAIEKSGCGTIGKIYANHDFEIEEMDFEVTTKSGQVVHVFFDGSTMDISQVCYQPTGLTVGFRTDAKGLLYQQYSIETLSKFLKEKNLKITNLRDVFCNIDELEPLFKANRTNQEIPRVSFFDTPDHLNITFYDK